VKIRNRRMLATGLTASLAAVVGGVAATSPADSQTTDTAVAEDDEGTEDADVEEQDPVLNGSIQVDEDESESETEEETRLAQLGDLISETAAIEAAGGGTADTAELGNENGTVVWEVAVTKDDGTEEEVKVDAGTSVVLAREADDENEADDNEADEGPEQDEDDDDDENESEDDDDEGPEGEEGSKV